MIGFGNTTALLWLAVLVPIVLCYLFRVRSRQATVSTTIFWQGLLTERRSRPSFRQLRNLLSLLMQLLFALLVILAMADLWFRPGDSGMAESSVTGIERTILIVDQSNSMMATDVLPSRFASAIQTAESLIDGLRSDDQMALIGCASGVGILCGLTSDRIRLREALQKLRTDAGSARMTDAVVAAQRMLQGTRTRTSSAMQTADRIVVLSDGCCDRPESAFSSTPGSASVRWHLIGKVADNVSITRYQAAPSRLDPIGYEVFCELANFGSDAVQCRLQLELNETIADVVPLELQPGERITKMLPLQAPSGGRLKLLVSDINPLSPGSQDAGAVNVLPVNVLTTDDQAVITLPEVRRIPVTLVTAGNLFLQRVLEAFPLVDLTVTDQIPTDQIPTDQVPAAAPAGGMLVLHRFVPQRMPAGTVLVITPESACELWDVPGTAEQPVVMSQDREDALLRNVDLADLQISQSVRLVPKAEHQVLVSSGENDPLLVRFHRSTGDVITVGIDLETGELPLRVAFPILFSNLFSNYCDVRPTTLLPEASVDPNEGNLRAPIDIPERQLLTANGHRLHAAPLLLCFAWVLIALEWVLFHRRWL